MKKHYIILSLSVLLTSCARKENDGIKSVPRAFSADSLGNYNFELLSTDYSFELSSRKFKIDFYEFTDSIRLSKVEENQIAKLFFENYIDTLNVDTVIRDSAEQVIMPNFGDSFYVYQKGVKKSFFRIIEGNYKSLEHLNSEEQNILFFRSGVLQVLKKNHDFKRCLDTLKAVKKYDKRLFL
jgi:hypothetical protein